MPKSREKTTNLIKANHKTTFEWGGEVDVKLPGTLNAESITYHCVPIIPPCDQLEERSLRSADGILPNPNPVQEGAGAPECIG